MLDSTPKSSARSCQAASQEVPSYIVAKEIRAENLSALKCNFCKRCGHAMSIQVPDGEDELRHACNSCGFIDYHNPRMV